MDELTIDGKVYISSKKAAKVSGYAKDYVGQLCREGRVDAKLVGRSWYVYEPSITEHRFNDERLKAKKKGLAGNTGAPEDAMESPGEKEDIDAAWERPSYTPEVAEPLPPLVPEPPKEAILEAPHAISQMQSAWQEWFSTQGQPKEPEAAAVPIEREAPAPHAPYVAAEAAVPVRMIVSDIAPIREEPRRTPPQEQKEARREAVKAKRKGSTAPMSPLIVKSLLGALIVIAVSIALVATGLIDALHIGGLTDNKAYEFLQGSNIISK